MVVHRLPEKQALRHRHKSSRPRKVPCTCGGAGREGAGSPLGHCRGTAPLAGKGSGSARSTALLEEYKLAWCRE